MTASVVRSFDMEIKYGLKSDLLLEGRNEHELNSRSRYGAALSHVKSLLRFPACSNHSQVHHAHGTVQATVSSGHQRGTSLLTAWLGASSGQRPHFPRPDQLLWICFESMNKEFMHPFLELHLRWFMLCPLQNGVACVRAC